MTLKELETHLLALTAAEKAQAVKLLALDLAHAWPGIEKMPGVAGGAACFESLKGSLIRVNRPQR